MTSRADHYRRAEELLSMAVERVADAAEHPYGTDEREHALRAADMATARAQVHATLATVSDDVAAAAHRRSSRPDGQE